MTAYIRDNSLPAPNDRERPGLFTGLSLRSPIRMKTTLAAAAGLLVALGAVAILLTGPVPSLGGVGDATDSPSDGIDGTDEAGGAGPGDGSDGSSDGATPTATPYPDGTPMADETPDRTATPTTPTPTVRPPSSGSAFAFTIDRVEECGDSCRRVTATVTNNRSAPATNVTLDLDLYAGNRTSGDPLWNGTERIGSLESGESVTVQREVELSTRQAVAIGTRDGWITLEAVVRSDETAETIRKRRNVF